MKRMALLICAWGVCMVSADRAAADAGSAERLLLSFEPDEIDAVVKKLGGTRSEGKAADGTAIVNVGMKPTTGFQNWTLYEGQASDGRWAAGIGLTRVRLSLERFADLPADSLLQQSVAYYGLYQDQWSIAAGQVFHTVGAFRRIFPADWSAYDLLRVDVYCLDTGHTVCVALEDEVIGPPVVRQVHVPAGKWMTLEVDLRAAAKQRGLDLTRMATLAIGAVERDGAPGTKRPHTALIDNLRLSSKAAKAKLPVLRDDRPHTLPACFRADTTPQPETLPAGRPDRSPLADTRPIVIDTGKPCFLSPVGWVAAYDNRHMLVGFNRGSKDAYVLQTSDGGATWAGLDGKGPSVVPIPEITHQCGPGDVVGRRADALVLTNIGCNGTALASLRLFAQKLTFTGRGWELRKTPALVDCDLRHCNSNHSIVRTADGRLWAGYGLPGRLGTLCINVRYSDDDGVTWRPSAPGTSGVIPGSIHADSEGPGFGYTHEEPRLVPLGKAVACIWQKRFGYEYGKVVWSRFDGRTWSDVQEIPTPKRSAYNPTRPLVHAVDVDGREIFLVSSWFDGVLHWRDGAWRTEAADIPAGSRIAVAGGRRIVVIAAVSDKTELRESLNLGKQAPVTLRAWQRRADGTWTGPKDVADEPISLAARDNMYHARPGFVVQPYSPPNFVPVAWSCGKDWIKVLRIPVEQ